MNLIQLIRKARLGVDAILPSGQVSKLWQDDEIVDLVEQASNEINLRLRLARKKWGIQTMSAIPQTSSEISSAGATSIVSTPVTVDGETYNPAVSLATVAGQIRVLLPPDFGEMVKIQSPDQTTMRFIKAEYESEYWTELEQSARNTDGTFMSLNSVYGLTMYYDIIDNRTLVLCPPCPTSFSMIIDYIPMKRPLRYSGPSTVLLTQGSTAVVADTGTWVSDNIYSELSNQKAELVWYPIGTTVTSVNTALRLDQDYPRVASITDDAHATLVLPWPLTTGHYPCVMAMCPTMPRVYHQWIAELTSTFMLRKVSPEISDKYAAAVVGRFDTTVRPTAGSRSSQMSQITDDETMMGGLTDR